MWILNDENFNAKTRPSKEATFTLGNGYFGVRGFFEEEQEGLLSLGGIYMAGVFGSGNFEAWNGENRELVNVPNFLSVKILCDGELVTQADCTDYKRTLDIQKGILNRSYVWKNKLKLEFERFVSVDDIHLVGQRIVFTPLADVKVTVEDAINTNTTNLNKVSCEPLPIQPGDKHYSVVEDQGDLVTVQTDGITPEKIVIKQFTEFKDNVFTRLAFVYTTRDCASPEDAIPTAPLSYEAYQEKHIAVWANRWDISDIKIEKSDYDQLALRYNLFQLIQSCPNNDSRVSIGARGLTGEMYEGCVFWDTEIFDMPYFIFENPEAAKQLLRFRYNVLPAAKKHAQDLWLKGAMYPWQSCNLGYEQTPKNGGAFYAIHIVSDIAYALMQYFRATDDVDFMIECGAEILIETSRFWVSRTTKRKTGAYDVMAVRGPNEYDNVVNNNCYTNMMVQENLANAAKIVELLKKEHPAAWAEIAKKTDFCEAEMAVWQDIADNIVICYDADEKLYEEDEAYTRRAFLDLKKAKPTEKRIIDSTMLYEELPLYQVTKQADVICLMNNLPLRFTKEEMQVAWDYYEPRTAHDSSLSYCSYSMMASKLGMDDIAYKYFKICAYLDIEDIKLNGISGLHFANFGGTWQIMVYGFAGLSMDGNTLLLNPHFPKEWGQVEFKVFFKGNLIKITAKETTASAEIIDSKENGISIQIN